MKTEITINVKQSLFVIPCGDYISSFGFDNAQRDTLHIATTLKRTDLMPTADDFGTLAGYAKYKRACTAWAASVFSKKTWFTQAAATKVKRLLEDYRESGKLVRLFYGDPSTGRDWGEENDVLGRIGRSNGNRKVPLLIEPGEDGGTAILTDNIIRIMDVESDREVYRHPLYQTPVYRIEPFADKKSPEYKWAAYEADKSLVACFREDLEAYEWRDFMTGKIAARRSDLQAALCAA